MVEDEHLKQAMNQYISIDLDQSKSSHSRVNSNINQRSSSVINLRSKEPLMQAQSSLLNTENQSLIGQYDMHQNNYLQGEMSIQSM